jgi:hypothetical protein
MITVKKYYPVSNRKDFFGYAVMENGKVAKGANDKNLIFIDKSRADEVAAARRRVKAKRAAK